jgi:hydroxylamine reductase
MVKITKKKEITEKIKLRELLKKNPKAGGILFEAGMHCIGCAMAAEETLEQGCLAHGMNKKEIKELIKKLNQK